MKRKIFVPLLATISLLSSCGDIRPLRSDIKEFIASFSVGEAQNNYLESSYTRIDLYHEPTEEIKTILTVSFNIKDQENATYEYSYSKYVDDVIDESSIRHTTIAKVDDDYLLIEDDRESVITYDSMVQNYVRHFFYREDVADVHSYGMYMGDILYESLPTIQDYVTVDFDKNTLTYDIPFGVKKNEEGYDFEELLIVNNLGMLVSFNSKIKSGNGIVTVESSCIVTNIP